MRNNDYDETTWINHIFRDNSRLPVIQPEVRLSWGNLLTISDWVFE